ncbi:hypothetical protein HDU67_000720, partial [Dinochytrium kinnereticum]
ASRVNARPLDALGLVDRWSPTARCPNPADSALVDEFLEVIGAEAAQAAILPVQSTPVFPPEVAT